MSATIVVIEYTAGEAQRSSPAEVWQETARRIAELPGLRWKYWLRGDGDRRGGVYLFDDADHAESASVGLVASLQEWGAMDVTRRLYDVDGDLTALTRGMIA